MSRGFPSMTALLGLLAIAGYQNRDKLADFIGALGRGAATTPGQPGASNTGLGGLLDQLRGTFSGASSDRILSGGLSELVDRFKQTGHGETADSWVGTGANKQLAPAQLEQAIGPEVLETAV